MCVWVLVHFGMRMSVSVSVCRCVCVCVCESLYGRLIYVDDLPR